MPGLFVSGLWDRSLERWFCLPGLMRALLRMQRKPAHLLSVTIWKRGNGVSCILDPVSSTFSTQPPTTTEICCRSQCGGRSHQQGRYCMKLTLSLVIKVGAPRSCTCIKRASMSSAHSLLVMIMTTHHISFSGATRSASSSLLFESSTRPTGPV